MYQDLHLYVDFDWEDYVGDPVHYLNRLFKIIDLAYRHKATVFYSDQQIQQFVGNCGDLDEGFSQSFGNLLDVVLDNAVGRSGSCRHFFEVCFSGENTSLRHVSDLAMAIVGPHSKNALISVTKSEYPPLLAIKSSAEFEAVKVDVLNDMDGLLAWAQGNSDKRIFNVSAKHGENGRGHWRGESPLLCNAADAQQLLNTAVPDFTERDKRLFNFDINHQTFIEFFYEGDTPQRQWHGFHVDAKDWPDRIPGSIRKHFNQ
jgi:hypothetical protein